MDMKRMLFYSLTCLLSVAACAPMSYTVEVEKRTTSADDIEFGDRLISMVALTQGGERDSLCMTLYANSLAMAMESELGREEGTIPLYPVRSEDIDAKTPETVSFLRDFTGGDFLIILDSLSIGDYSVVSRNSYSVEVSLPFSLSLVLYAPDSELPVKKELYRDTCLWTLVAQGNISEKKAISKIDAQLQETFAGIGSEAASLFLPEWKVLQKRLFLYNDSRWIEAFECASRFEWKNAMDIWLKLVKSPDKQKAGYAAHNLSIACEILEMPDLSLQWKEYSKQMLK